MSLVTKKLHGRHTLDMPMVFRDNVVHAGMAVRFRTAATSIAVVVVLLTIGLERPTAGSPSVRTVPLNVLLTVSANLPSVARTVLSAEAERIWRSEGVDI